MFKLGKNKIVSKNIYIHYDGDYLKKDDVEISFLEDIYKNVHIRWLCGCNPHYTTIALEFKGPKCEIEKISSSDVIYRIYKKYPHLLEEGQFHKLL